MDEEHQISRYFVNTDVLGDTQHYVQCTCGEKFKGSNDRDVMRKQFRHAWAKVNHG